MSTSPEIHSYLIELAKKLDLAVHGQRGSIIEEAQEFLGWPPQTIYRRLKQQCGWKCERKTRSDKGKTSVSRDALIVLGAASRESVRDNGKQTLFTTTARGMLEQNGHEFGVSNSQLNRLLRSRKLNVKAQMQVNPVQALRALHPNHVHEVDPSLCLIYYMKNKQYIMREREFYKNKLENYAKIKYKVWRYTLYDRASGHFVPWYVESAGENQHVLFQFLMFAWSKQDSRLFHGVPKIIYWDKGSANTSSAIKNLLDHLEVTYLEHEAGNARAKGGVENANNIIETQFESRLRFEPVEDIAQLNKAATAWAEAYNANRIPGQDTRLNRRGLAEPISRHDLWQLIRADELRLLPSIEVCQALMTSKEQERTVRNDMTIGFKHPQSDQSLAYSLKGLDGVTVKDKVYVRALVYGDCAIQIQAPRYDGEMLIYRVEPERNYDRFGQLLDAAVIGEEYKSQPETIIEQASKEMDELAYPGQTPEEVKKSRAKQAVPFSGLNAHGYFNDIEHPTYLPKQGTEIDTPEHLKTPVSMLSATAAMLRISGAIGRSLSVDENKWLASRYKDGLPEDSIQSVIQLFTQPVAAVQDTGTTGLRAI
ncbi:transposase [Limnobaculum zhutongyuii]|uniref:Transposase n=1 Tax=Limnobaculum zhutongyuii TaxID=2498113 RepID=A0A411WHI1_9GAMM|nr:DDE-type integrase/transposase/recombinase [Limnobaculum zhutongyuii]QBH95750.1 transposase [Limnobaculum zhutongyuii]TQS86133.1 transposase [Limnobaculum zhutongyuii]